MGHGDPIYVLGSGAIGFPLAAYLTEAGRTVVAVRTSKHDVPRGIVTVTLGDGAVRARIPVETISLSRLTQVAGTIVVATKAYANDAVALQLVDKGAAGPVVVMQNGVSVERPFVDAGFPQVYRCVLYITSQSTSEYEFTVRPVTASPIGVFSGDDAALEGCVEELSTDGFPFRSEPDIHREVWKKAIVNVVFNSICPLLEVDNGIFIRDAEAASMAMDLVRECVTLAARLDLGLGEEELMEQVLRISRASDGQLISTLQDLRTGRETEMESLNLELVRVAASLQPRLELPRVESLGRMILARSLQQRGVPGPA
jgi:2-dehydropantoate 2-reductase